MSHDIHCQSKRQLHPACKIRKLQPLHISLLYIFLSDLMLVRQPPLSHSLSLSLSLSLVVTNSGPSDFDCAKKIGALRVGREVA